MKRIACIGEVMVELIVQGPDGAALNMAGDTYNTAVYLSRLSNGQGVEVSYITALGMDGFSARALSHMQDEGLDTHHVVRDPGRTIGHYAIETDDTCERRFTYWRSDSAARGMFGADGPSPDLSGFDLVFISGITLAILPPQARARLIAALVQFCAGGGQVAYDSNHRPLLWKSVQAAREINAQIWARTDIALPSVDDEKLIYADKTEADVLAGLAGHGLRTGALKRGEKGQLGLPGHGKSIDFAPVRNVVDTTAACDSFNAGFLSQIALGRPKPAALSVGHAIAVQVVRAKGDIVPVRLPD